MRRAMSSANTGDFSDFHPPACRKLSVAAVVPNFVSSHSVRYAPAGKSSVSVVSAIRR